MRPQICPPGMAEAAWAASMSPAIQAGDSIYLTSAVGVQPDGSMPEGAVEQTEVALSKVLNILTSIGANASAIVYATSYQVDIGDHFDKIQATMVKALGTPLPTWPAVAVKGMWRSNALVEVRCVSHHPTATSGVGAV